LQDALKFAKVKLLAAFAAALAWVGLVPPFLLAVSAPSIAYFFLWVGGVAADFYTTYRFYRENPANFAREETSGYMKRLYRRFGFKAGLIAFLALVEIPVALVISFTLIPASARVFRLPQPEALACLSSGLAFLGIGHVAAAAWNYRRELEERRIKSG